MHDITLQCKCKLLVTYPANAKSRGYTQRFLQFLILSVRLLGKVGNSKNIPGVPKQVAPARNSEKRVSWSDVARGNL